MELFHLEDGRILLNEIAPRPHNSGHYTIEGCPCDQYQSHLRAILGRAQQTTPASSSTLCTAARRVIYRIVLPVLAASSTALYRSDQHCVPLLAASSPHCKLSLVEWNDMSSHDPASVVSLALILGWPLGDTSLRVGGAVMKNLIGDGEGPVAMTRMHDLMGAALQARELLRIITRPTLSRRAESARMYEH